MKNVLAKISIALASVMVLSTASVASAAPVRLADGYPTKPVVNIVSWAAGGATDIGQRLVANFFPRYLDTTMVIENQAGGAAVPGTTAIARARPDGYTIGVNWTASWTLRPFILDVPYTIDDFVFIIGMIDQVNFLLVRGDSPFKTLDDLVRYAKANPGKLNFSGGAAGAFQHMVGATLAHKAGFQAEHIPYDGSRPAGVALLGGNLDFAIIEPANVTAELKAGTLRALCSFQSGRVAQDPDVPTARELGFDVVFPQTQVIVGPKGIPADRVQALHDAFKQVFENPEFLKLASNAGLDIVYKPGEVCRQEIIDTIKMVEPIIDQIFPGMKKK